MKHYSLPKEAQYWVDDMGYLWAGPVEGGPGKTEDMPAKRYLRFEGVREGKYVDNIIPVWKFRSRFHPPGACEYTVEQAEKIVNLHVFHAYTLRTKGEL